MFTIEMLPANSGDALWIEYGEPGDIHRILVDGGTAGTAELLGPRLAERADAGEPLELMVVSHVDCDHIEGIRKLFDDGQPPVPFKELWFNNYGHLPGTDEPEGPGGFGTFGPKHGELLTDRLEALGLESKWNAEFGSKDPVVVPDSGALHVVELDGGMKLTVLSPGLEQLEKLKPFWEKECAAAGISLGLRFDETLELPPAPATFGDEVLPDVEALANTAGDTDDRQANGSSIALLAEYGGRRALLAADAHPDVLAAGIERVPGFDGKLTVDVFKLPHHGSDANVTTDLLNLVECDRYLISTKGHGGHDHPGKAAMSRVIVHGRSAAKPTPHLVFNYHTDLTKVWEADELQDEHDYTAEYPATSDGGIVIEV